MAPQDIIEFDRVIGTDVVSYAIDVNIFESESLPKISAFFKGSGEFLDSIHVTRLNDLIEAGRVISRKLNQSSHLLQTLMMQDIASMIEDLILNIEYYSRIDKFSRATTRLPSTQKGVIVNHTISRGTLEEVSREQLGSNDFDNDWINIAKYNDLYEVDYDYNGGERIDIVYPISSVRGANNAVLDYMFRENLLGKDISKSIEFLGDDFVVLSPERTFVQSVEILSGLERGDIPEFPRLGRSPFIGQEAAVFAYASIVRQLRQVFVSDATVSSLQVNGYNIENGDVNLLFSVTNIRDDIAVQQSINIQ